MAPSASTSPWASPCTRHPLGHHLVKERFRGNNVQAMKLPSREVAMRLWVTLTLGLLLAGCAYAPPPPPPPPPPPRAAAGPPPPAYGPPPPARVVRTRIGPVLATPGGMTLYTFTRRGRDVPCYGKCALAWPPFIAPRRARPHGPWSLAPRARGLHQWAFMGHRLYAFIRDHAPGETHGNNIRHFGGLWHVARP